jgi:hypothetical protein
MHVSQATLVDLDILHPGPRGPRLASWIDSTATPEGSAALVGIVLASLGTASAIVERQRDLRTLSKLRSSFPWKRIADALGSVRRYLGSSYIELPPSAARCMAAIRLYPDHCAEVAGGLEALHVLGATVSEFSSLLASRAVGSADEVNRNSELRAFVHVIESFLNLSALRALLRFGSRRGMVTRSRMLALDSRFRREARPVIESLLDTMARLDALCALSALVEREGFTFPEITDGTIRTMKLSGLFHPQLSRPVVSNVSLSASQPLMLLTGPNMAGKSTLLRSIGISIVLAHLGAPVPAKGATVTLCDALLVALSVRDDIGRGESYFLAEVRQVKHIINKMAERSAVVALIDEPFKGTNVSDALDATWLLGQGLLHAERSISVLTTHLVEVAERFADDSHVKLACFEAMKAGDGWTFDYELTDGISTQRLGMALLEREGVVRVIESMISQAAAGA